MNKMVVFVDQTKAAPRPLYVRVVWCFVACIAVIAFVTFIIRPDWWILPPGIK